MTTRIKIAALCFYVAMVINTFGHAAADSQAWYDEHCESVEQRITVGSDCYGSPVVMPSIGAGVFWPLYWSWKLWE